VLAPIDTLTRIATTKEPQDMVDWMEQLAASLECYMRFLATMRSVCWVLEASQDPVDRSSASSKKKRQRGAPLLNRYNRPTGEARASHFRFLFRQFPSSF
jgi:hypothetical protein